MLNNFGAGIVKWASTYENASKYNRQLTAPSQCKPERDTVLPLCRKNYALADKWYRRRLRPIRIKRAIRAAVPRPVKNLLKKVLRKQ